MLNGLYNSVTRIRAGVGIAIIAVLSACEGDRSNVSVDDVAAVAGYAFTNASVVPMTSERVDADHTVVVSDGRIVAVGPSSDVRVPAGVTVIDASGKYLAPGLADMHAHPFTQFDLDVYLANGVTLIRSMWGEPRVLEFRDGIAAGERRGPRVVTGGRIVDGEPLIHYGTDKVLDAGDAEAVVARQKAAGYDFIKVYSNLTQDAFDAIAAAANQHDIPFAGHIPHAVPAGHAFRSGMQTAEHMLGISPATLVDGADYVWRFDPTFKEYAERIGDGRLDFADVYDPAKLEALGELAAETGIWTVPTLVTLRGTALPPDAVREEWQRPEWEYVDYTVQSFWKMLGSMRAGWSDAAFRGAAKQLQQEMRQLKAFHDAGARILAGTDAPNPYAYVGFGVVDELAIYVDAGLTPYEALRTATTAPAEFLGETGSGGIVADSARADLVLLDANPLEDVSAYREIAGVMADGKWLDRDALDDLLAGIAANNERKAAFFADAPPWMTGDDEQVTFTAEFVLRGADLPVVAERIAPLPQADGSSVYLGQRKLANGSYRHFRLERGAEGEPLRLSVSESADGEVSELFELESGDTTLITHTSLDWLALAPAIADMADGETRRIDVQIVDGDGALTPGQMTITRHPAEILDGHFYFTGANRHEVTISTAGGETQLDVWMGGGFYAGWPVRLELEQAGRDAESTRYDRIL